MLSTAAWNAFLKTLEEPPPNTVFVLATTEAQKVPATVVDRCHRFDFHRPTVEQIASVLSPHRRRPSRSRSRPQAVAALARSATGSFRDALGTLEQLVTYSGARDRARGRARRARRGRRATAGRDRRRGRRRRCPARAAARRSLRSSRAATPASFAARPRGAGARAADRADPRARCRPSCRSRPRPTRALPAQAERVGRMPSSCGCSSCSARRMEAVRAGADARTRLELALVKAARPELDGSLRALLARIERLEERGADRSPRRSGPPRASPAPHAAPREPWRSPPPPRPVRPERLRPHGGRPRSRPAGAAPPRGGAPRLSAGRRHPAQAAAVAVGPRRASR